MAPERGRLARIFRRARFAEEKVDVQAFAANQASHPDAGGTPALRRHYASSERHMLSGGFVVMFDVERPARKCGPTGESMN
jgi:hypothetical protein